MQATLSTGVIGLDQILGGGLPRGHLYLTEGDPGAGKTTLALQFLLAGRDAGETVLYCTLSENEVEVKKIAASHGWDLTGLNILEMTPTVEAATGEESYTVFRPSDIELGETTKRLLDEVERVDPSRVVIDSLSELRLLAHEPLRYRRQILGLKHYFAGKNRTVMLLDDRTVVKADLQPQSIAHGVLELDRLPSEYGAERRRLRMIKLRGSDFSGGYHDFAIRTGGLAVFPRISEQPAGGGFEEESVSTGIDGLDALLGGGIDRGTSTLLTGPTGTGKSTLALSLVNAAIGRGEHAAIFCFEENERIIAMRAEAMGVPFAEQLDAGRLAFRSILPAELSPGEFAAGVRDAVELGGATVVVLDSLNGYLNAMPEERFLIAQMHELLRYLSDRGVMTVLLLAQHGGLSPNVHPPINVSYLSDTVVTLRLFEAAGMVRKSVAVIKKRTGHHESTIRELHFERGGVRVGEPLRGFSGVLSGMPVYTGSDTELIERKNGA